MKSNSLISQIGIKQMQIGYTSILAFILALVAISSMGIAYADPPIPMNAEAEFTQTVVSQTILGNSRIREITGVATITGSFDGTVERTLRLQTNLNTGRSSVQNTLTCTCDVKDENGVTLASGTFVFNLMGSPPNIHWVVVSSDLLDTNGNPVKLSGQGSATAQFTGVVSCCSPLIFTILNTFDGQIDLH